MDLSYKLWPYNWRRLWEELVLQWSIKVIVGSGPHQTSSHHAESANVRQQNELHNLEREKDLDNYQEGSLQTLHTSGSDFRRKGRAVHEQGDEKAMQLEIDDLKRQLRRAQRKQSPPRDRKSVV